MYEISRNKNLQPFYKASLKQFFFLLLICNVFILVINYLELKHSFNQKSAELIEGFNSKLLLNESILNGFESLVAHIETDDVEATHGYAKQILGYYPYVYMLEIVKKTTNKTILVNNKVIHIKKFKYDTDRRWEYVTNKEAYYPIINIEPKSPESNKVIGMDIGSIDHLRLPLETSIKTNNIISSKIFKLVEGDNAYVLFKKVNIHKNHIRENNETIVLMVVLINNLIPENIDTTYSINIGPFDNAVNTNNLLAINKTVLSSLTSQPLHFNISKEPTHKDINLYYFTIGNIILFTLFFMHEKTKQVKRRLIEKENNNIFLQHEVENDKHLLSLIIKAQEKECARISQFLHDDIGQYLTAVSLNVASLDNETLGQSSNKDEIISSIKKHINHIYSSMHNISRSLNPFVITNSSLESSVMAFASIYKNTNVDILLSVNINEELISDNIKINTYRIMQEAINNIFKHADAKKINIHLMTSEINNEINALIEDDGVGDIRLGDDSLGLYVMNERAESCGGVFCFCNRKEGGSAIAFSIPLNSYDKGIESDV